MSGHSGGSDTWPCGWGVALAPGTRRRRASLIGGSPLRVVRLSRVGGQVLDGWLAGAAVGDGAAPGRLARRLTDSGLGTPVLPAPGAAPPVGGPPDTPAVTVVIPVHNRPDGLVVTLKALQASGIPSRGGATGSAEVSVIVVDDGSDRPAEVPDAVVAAGVVARVLRQPWGGPAAARNLGWKSAGGGVAVFLDADCVPDPGWLEVLLGHMDDPSLAAVAPRVLSGVGGPGDADAGDGTAEVGEPIGRGARLVQAYEEVRSPLDMGPLGSPVRPGAAVTYVPSAALAVRIEALRQIDGFDHRLCVGEDVDLVWRLTGSGWRVRYEPAARVTHPPRPTLRAWARQRWDYGTSAAPLAARHGGAVAPLALPWRNALGWAALPFLPGPAAAAAAALATGWTTRRVRIRAGLGVHDALALAAAGQLKGGRTLAEALRRAWWPLAGVVGVMYPKVGRKLAGWALAPLVVEWVQTGRSVGVVRWLGMRVADDITYGAGVWAGCWRERRLDALLPRLGGPTGRHGWP